MRNLKKKNPGTVGGYELDNNSSIKKLFICPGVMNNKLRFARPVMALDAAHLSVDNQGTLFLACMKTKHNKKRCPKVEGYANLIAQGLIIPDTESEQSDDSSASDKEDRKPKAKRTRTNKKPTERSESSFY